MSNVEKYVEEVLPNKPLPFEEDYHGWYDGVEFSRKNLAQAIRQGKLVIPRQEDAEKAARELAEELFIKSGLYQRAGVYPYEVSEERIKQIKEALLSFSPKPQTERNAMKSGLNTKKEMARKFMREANFIIT